MTTQILTDTPVKVALEKKRAETKKPKGQTVRKQLIASKKNNKAKGTKTKKASHQKTTESCLCLVCEEDFLNSRPRETWVQCMGCQKWAHLACTEGGPTYVCHRCE